ncbi:hypothetical protein, partial [Arsenophonus endosymbiont of Bemisia tabaci]|uniref:hypothetical protein n=1 Tax=Arsenophonus endosymbiont of Bemisia tabaci TaxID=536059 RepID=UPI001EE32F1A
LNINGNKLNAKKERSDARERYFVRTQYGVIKIKSLSYRENAMHPTFLNAIYYFFTYFSYLQCVLMYCCRYSVCFSFSTIIALRRK